MDKTTHSSSEDPTSTNANANSNSNSNNNNNNNRDQYLRHLNKISHRIAKPIRRPPFDHPLPPQPIASLHAPAQNLHAPAQNLHAPPHNLQPPVYNINKSDFRDVVQKLTGSPAPERFSSPPPPIHPPKPQSSRLQRIRPPPLAGVTNRPAPAASVNGNPNCTAPSATAAPFPGGNFVPVFRQVSPASPLPPFPSVHGAAESPISAYMRYLQGGDSEPKNFPRPPISPRWNTSGPPPHLPPQPPATAPLQFPAMPLSPLPFGCLPSPRSPYPMLSPGLLFSPGFPQLPVSPRVPVTSPRRSDL